MQKIAIISLVCLVVGICVSNGYVANNNEEIDEEIKTLVRALADTKENVEARQESDGVEHICRYVCDGDDDCRAKCVACIRGCGEDGDCVDSCFGDDEEDGGDGDGSKRRPRLPRFPIRRIPWFPRFPIRRWSGKK